MNKKYIVYRFIFENLKSYIGVTGDLKKRIIDHKYKAKKNINKPLYNAINLYNNFSIEILSTHRKENKAYFSEIYFIKKYNTVFPNGYNIAEGGRGVKGKILKKYYPRTLKQQINSSRVAKNILSNYVNSKKVKIKCSNGIEYESISSAAKETNIDSSLICRVLYGKQIQTNGLTFYSVDSTKHDLIKAKFRKKVLKSKKELCKRLRLRSKPILRSDGKKFNSCKDAAIELNVTPEAIRACLKGRCKKTKGFIFTYINENDITVKQGDK